MKRALLWLTGGLVLLGVTAGAGAAWLVTTNSGLQSLVALATHYLPGKLTIAGVEGRLVGPMTLDQVRYEHGGMVFAAGNITADWVASALVAGTVHVNYLVADNVSITIPDQHPDTEQPATASLPDIRLPLRVKLDELKLDSLSVNQAGTPVTINQIQLSAYTQFEQLHIDTLRLSTDQGSISVHGTLSPFGGYRHDLAMNWQLALPDTAVVSGQGTISGNLDETRLQAQVQQPFRTDMGATVTSALQHPHWVATLRAPHIDTSKLNTAWPGVRGEIDIAASGTLTEFESQGRVNAKYEQWEKVFGDFALSGDLHGALRIHRFDLKREGAPGAMRLAGSWLPDGRYGRIDADLTWRDLAWPLSGAPVVASPQGRLHVEGVMDGYNIAADGAVRFPPVADGQSTPTPDQPTSNRSIPPLDFTLQGSGNADGLQIPALTLRTLDGSILGQATVGWQPQVHWTAALQGKDLNPAVIDSRWPGSLGLVANSAGRIADAGIIGNLSIQHVAGTVRNRPVDLRGDIAVVGKQITIADARLASGQSQATLSGVVGDQVAVDIAIRSADLQEFHPAAKGKLNIAGHLSGERLRPLLNIDIDGRGMAYENSSIANLSGTASIRLVDWAISSIRLSGDRINTGTIQLDTLHIEGSGSRQTGGVTLIAVASAGTLVARAISQTDEPATTVTIDRADLLVTSGGTWLLDQPATVTVMPDRLSTQHLCWSRTDAPGSGCVAVERTQQEWQSTAHIEALPLLALSRFIPQQPVWSGNVTLRFSGESHSERGASGTLSIHLDEGEMSYPLLEGETGQWRYRDGDITVKLGPEGLDSSLLVHMENDDRIDARVALPALDPATFDGNRQPVKGTVNLRISQTGLIDILIPEVQQSRGNIAVVLTLGGTIAAIQIDGNLRLHDGQFNVPRLGLTITEMAIDGENIGAASFQYRLTARSGDGTLLVSGITRINQKAGWPTELKVTGSDFEISRTPEARITVSPDLAIHVTGREIHVDGQVTIPYARLQPQDLSGAVNASDDVVIIGAESVAEERWKIFTRVRLVLGDRVSLYGFGFEGRVTGNLLLTDRPGEVTTGSGELSVAEGRYRAYGQRLNIERGLLLFAGGPVSNPGLDLRAVRQVDNVTAGVQVRGTLRSPQFDLFASPAMGETDALSYLVLGRPLESGSSEDARLVAEAALLLSLKGGDFLARSIGDRFGLDEMRIETGDTGDQASLVIGRYLSPRLYVSYGVGLVDSVNTFNARYQLSRRWQLRAESGLHQSTDAVYTIER